MQGNHHDAAIAVEVRAFIENFVGFRVKLQRGRAWLGQHFAVRGDDVAFGLGAGVVCKQHFFARH
jgi:hypothetical protein